MMKAADKTAETVKSIGYAVFHPRKTAEEAVKAIKSAAKEKGGSYIGGYVLGEAAQIAVPAGTARAAAKVKLPQTKKKKTTKEKYQVADTTKESTKKSHGKVGTVEDGSNTNKLFKTQSLLDEHYDKHGQEIADILGDSSYSIDKYLDDANYIINNGIYTPELNGYVCFVSGKKYGFVGIDRITGDITTFHIKNLSELAKKAPSLGFERYVQIMQIEEINWLDIRGEEAVIKVVSATNCLVCFSCPCTYDVGDVLTEPLECLDAYNIMLCETAESIIEKMQGEFKYKLKGELKDKKKGIVEVKGFIMHIDEDKIPKDMSNGMCIQFEVSRIDIW